MATDEKSIRDSILQLAAKRGDEKTICPSEVARALQPDDWRVLMPAVRSAAAELVDEGKVRVMRYGADVDALNPGGHIRIQIVQPPTTDRTRKK